MIKLKGLLIKWWKWINQWINNQFSQSISETSVTAPCCMWVPLKQTWTRRLVSKKFIGVGVVLWGSRPEEGREKKQGQPEGEIGLRCSVNEGLIYFMTLWSWDGISCCSKMGQGSQTFIFLCSVLGKGMWSWTCQTSSSKTVPKESWLSEGPLSSNSSSIWGYKSFSP